MIEVQKVLTCVSVNSVDPRIKTSRENSCQRSTPRWEILSDSHSLFFFNGPHSQANVFVFEFLNDLPVSLKVDGVPVFRVIWLANTFVRSSDPSVVGFEYRVFKEESECRHLRDHYPSMAVELVSEVGV